LTPQAGLEIGGMTPCDSLFSANLEEISIFMGSRSRAFVAMLKCLEITNTRKTIKTKKRK
jgi:hypothetical protein